MCRAEAGGTLHGSSAVETSVVSLARGPAARSSRQSPPAARHDLYAAWPSLAGRAGRRTYGGPRVGDVGDRVQEAAPSGRSARVRGQQGPLPSGREGAQQAPVDEPDARRQAPHGRCSVGRMCVAAPIIPSAGEALLRIAQRSSEFNLPLAGRRASPAHAWKARAAG